MNTNIYSKYMQIYQISYPISDLSNQVLGGKILCRSAVCFTEEGPVWPELPPTAQHSVVRVETKHLPSLAWKPRSLAPVSSTEMITNDIVMKTSDDENMKTWQASRLRKRNRALQPPLKHVHTEVRGEAARSSLLSAGHPHHRHEKLQCKPLKSQNQDKHKLLS